MDPSIPDTLRLERTVLIVEVSSITRFKLFYVCQSIVKYLIPVAHINNKGVRYSGSYLEEIH